MNRGASESKGHWLDNSANNKSENVENSVFRGTCYYKSNLNRLCLPAFIPIYKWRKHN